MKLIITVDIDLEESGLDKDSLKDNIVGFTKDLLINGAADKEIGLTIREVDYDCYDE